MRPPTPTRHQRVLPGKPTLVRALRWLPLLSFSLIYTMCTAPPPAGQESTKERVDLHDTQKEALPPDAGEKISTPDHTKETPLPDTEEKTSTPDNTNPKEEPNTPDFPPGTPYACPTLKTTPVPTTLGLDPFYKKYLDAGGIPIVGSQKVPDTAFAQAYYVIANMLHNKPCIRKGIADSGIRIGIIAESETTTQMPEYKDLNTAFPGTDWDKRARGLGSTLVRPLTSGAEENLLQKQNDRWFGENIFLHEFAHSLFEFGIVARADGPTQQQTLQKLYSDAIQAGLWDKTYAKTNANEYWAETVQSWFNNNLSASPPNGVHNDINTREKLEKYDPKVAAFISQFFDPTPWSAYCTTSGNGRPWKDPTPTDLSGASCQFQRTFLKNLGCPNAPQTKSQSSSEKQQLTFVNRHMTQTYNIQWIDEQGQRKEYGKIAPRRSSPLSTFKGHSWLISDAQGTCVGLYTTTHPDNVLVLE